jgi:spore coat protein CotH
VPLPFQPETNEGKPDLATGLVSFVRAINDTPRDSFVSAIAPWIDVDQFLTHVAVENTLTEKNKIVNDFGLNNFYLYEYNAKNRFVFIP